MALSYSIGNTRLCAMYATLAMVVNSSRCPSCERRRRCSRKHIAYLGRVPAALTNVDSIRAFNLKCARIDFELMWTQAAAGVVLASKVVGEGACGELGRGSMGLGDETLVARQTGGRGAIGALAAMEDLGEIAVPGSVRAVDEAKQRRYGPSNKLLEAQLACDLVALEQSASLRHRHMGV